MAESSTRVADATSGNYIGTRDANENDASANAREITLVDQSTRQAGFTFASPTRTLYDLDSSDVTSLSSAITASKLTVGDQATLIVSAHINVPSYSALSFAVVPLILDASNNVLGILTPKTLQGYRAASEARTDHEPDTTHSIGYDDSGDFFVICPLLSWRLNGAGPYIALLFTGDRDDIEVKLYAALVSGGESGFADGEPDSHSDYGFTIIEPGTGGGGEG